MLFLTYNDAPSGIYFSQVTDVCNFLNERLDAKIKLVALISLRNFCINRKKIKSEISNSIVLPMIPGVGNWRFNYFLLRFLFLFVDSNKVIARGPFAASLALRLKKNRDIKFICFDARGAYDAELKEYDVVRDERIKKEIYQIEKEAVLNSDFRIAVSDKLVEYWKEKFKYVQNNHVIVPCTFHSKFFKDPAPHNQITEIRKSLGYTEEDIVLVYSGSVAGWQSFQLADRLLSEIMKNNSRVKLLILSKKVPDMKIIREFEGRIKMKRLDEKEMSAVLSCCDYGILLRENSVTNKVSSPVKFAECLISGLKIIISENVGDYSEFVKNNNCGFVISENVHLPHLDRVSIEGRERLRKLASDSFSKESQLAKYKLVLN